MNSKETLINPEPVEYKIFPSVQIILLRQNQPEPEVFLVHRITDSFYGQWSFPGGKVDSGETVLDAACRETFEETGIPLKSNELHFFKTGVSQTIRQINNRLTHCQYIIDVFFVNADHLTPFNASPSEHDVARWFTFGQALQTHQQAIEIVQNNNQIISPDKIPNALAPKTLEALKLLSHQY